jgi:transcriptional regulator with XRE-family HTH domain
LTYKVSAIGDALRRARIEQRMSLNDVADKADISIATLSRIETNKQNLDVSLLLTLSRILKVPVTDLLDIDGEGDGAVALTRQLARMSPAERARLIIDSRSSNATAPHVNFDDLLATLDILRNELLAIHRAVKSRRDR